MGAAHPNPSRPRAGVILLGVTALYVACFVLAWRRLHLMIAPTATLPVVLGAWWFGVRGGLGVAAPLALLHLAFYYGALDAAAGPLLDSVLGNALLIGIGLGIGALRQRALLELARLRETEERYALAARGADDGLFDWDLITGEVHVSERVTALLGIPPGELSRSPDAWLARVHPADLPEARHRLRRHLRGETPRYEAEHRLRRQDGSWVWTLGRAVASFDERGRAIRLTGWLTDITAQKRTEEQLRQQAFYDALTGLPNRALFSDRLEQALARARRHDGDEKVAVILLDLDRFKVVNDSLGHVAGDELLVAVARRLHDCLRPGDTAARLGGDELMVLLEGVRDRAEAERHAERLRRALAKPLPLMGHDVVCEASLGVAMGDGGADPHALLRDADTAMHEAKRRGGGQHVVFDPAMHAQAVDRLTKEHALKGAAQRGEIRVFYQPIVDLRSGEIVAFEALARWRHPTLGTLPPPAFIPLAEETGEIAQLGQWILLEACGQAKAWSETFGRPLRVSVNLSVRQIHDEHLLAHVKEALQRTRLPPAQLALEITESMLLKDVEAGTRMLAQLRAEHLLLYMDDFGTGYSSLAYLQRFQMDALKIDGAFVRNLGRPGGEVVRSILTLAHSLGLKAVAEGVETTEQLEALRKLGCAEAQGYLFCRPQEAPEIEQLLRAAPSW